MGKKNTGSKFSFVQTSSMKEDKIFHTGSMKKLVVQKCNCNVRNGCLCLDRSAISSHSALRSSTDHYTLTTENVDVKCAAIELFNMRSFKNCLRLDLLDCEDILLCCSGGTDLVFIGLSGCARLTIQNSRHFSLSLQRC